MPAVSTQHGVSMPEANRGGESQAAPRLGGAQGGGSRERKEVKLYLADAPAQQS